MKIKMVVVCVVVMLLFSWVAIKQVLATGKCEGGVYVDHPALQLECQHQQTVNTSNYDPYPSPDSEPYPVPISTQVTPRQLPTEPPGDIDGQ